MGIDGGEGSAKGLVTSTNKISCVFLNFMPCFRIAIFLPNIFHCNWFLIVSSTFYKIENSSPSQTIIFSTTKKVKFSISMDHWFHRLKFILKHPFSPHPSIFKFYISSIHLSYHPLSSLFCIVEERTKRDRTNKKPKCCRTQNVRCYFFSKLYMHLSTRDINGRASLKTGPVIVAD